jgi:hypothetical protein
MNPLRGLGAALIAVSLVLLAACSGGGEPEAAVEVPEGWVVVETEVGSVARPEEWQPQDAPQAEGQVESFAISEGGEVVAQMDVLVNSITPGTKADTVDAAIQGARMTGFPQLEHTRREFTEVPGAASAFVTESTYVTADTGQDARSIDQVAVAENGRYLLVRLTALAEAYDEELFTEVLDTVRLEAEVAS